MSKHTPGEWKQSGPFGFNVIAKVNGEWSPIASTRNNADAQLMAASLDLLEALKICQVRIFMLEGSENEAYQMADAAISKAEATQ